MNKKTQIKTTNWLTRGISKEQLEREKQEAIMSADIQECFAEFSFDFDAIGEKMVAKGYRKQKWISVEERLPKHEQKCLIFTMIHFTPDHVDDVNYYFGIEISMYTTDFGFLSTNGMYARYWMPLPEPPQMKRGV